MDKAKQQGIVKGVLGDILDNGVNGLQYADDTIFLLPYDLFSVENLKFTLSNFEQICGLTINFHKVSLFFLEKSMINQLFVHQLFEDSKFGAESMLDILGPQVSKPSIH